jgi:ribosomal protein L11 methyltransferase
MRWIEVSVRVDNEAVEAVSELFQRFAHGGVVIDYATEPGQEIAWDEPAELAYGEPVTVRGYFPRTREGSRRRRELEQALGHLGAIWPIPDPTAREVREEDWANAWKEHFFAHRVGERLVIKPSWREFEGGPGDLVVTLDPGMAFGTGLHPTTKLCLVALERLVAAGDRVFDVGTGSGILALAAARLGASSVLAVDLDEIAVQAARENVETNGLAERIAIGRGSVDAAPDGERYDLVVANIIARVIVDLAPALAARVRPGGRLVASGILDVRRDEVAAALAAGGLAVEETLTEADWIALVCRKDSA